MLSHPRKDLLPLWEPLLDSRLASRLLAGWLASQLGNLAAGLVGLAGRNAWLPVLLGGGLDHGVPTLGARRGRWIFWKPKIPTLEDANLKNLRAPKR